MASFCRGLATPLPVNARLQPSMGSLEPPAEVGDEVEIRRSSDHPESFPERIGQRFVLQWGGAAAAGPLVMPSQTEMRLYPGDVDSERCCRFPRSCPWAVWRCASGMKVTVVKTLPQRMKALETRLQQHRAFLLAQGQVVVRVEGAQLVVTAEKSDEDGKLVIHVRVRYETGSKEGRVASIVLRGATTGADVDEKLTGLDELKKWLAEWLRPDVPE